MRRWIWLALVVAFAAALVIACVGDDGANNVVTADSGAEGGCAVGSEGCPCTSGGACNNGLLCLSNTCVNPDAGAQGGNDSGSGNDSSSGNDSGTGNGDGGTSADSGPVSCNVPIAKNQVGLGDIVADPATGQVYWTTGVVGTFDAGVIMTAQADGGGAKALIADPNIASGPIATNGQVLFWSEGSELMSAQITGAGVAQAGHGTGATSVAAITANASIVFWTMAQTQGVFACNVGANCTGAGVTPGTMGAIAGIHYDSVQNPPALYWTDPTPASGGVHKCVNGCGAPADDTVFWMEPNAVSQVTSSGISDVFWTTTSGEVRGSLNGSASATTIASKTGAKLGGLATDGTNIFFLGTDSGGASGVYGTTKGAGGGAPTLLGSVAVLPATNGITYGGGYFFWIDADPTNGTVYRRAPGCK